MIQNYLLNMNFKRLQLLLVCKMISAFWSQTCTCSIWRETLICYPWISLRTSVCFTCLLTLWKTLLMSESGFWLKQKLLECTRGWGGWGDWGHSPHRVLTLDQPKTPIPVSSGSPTPQIRGWNNLEIISSQNRTKRDLLWCLRTWWGGGAEITAKIKSKKKGKPYSKSHQPLAGALVSDM